jgi:hypothetical protein
MTMPKTSVHSIDLDNLEREMRRIAVSRRSVGRAKLPRIVGRPASVAPFDSSIRHEKDEPPTENGPALEAAIPQGLDSGSFGSIPHTPSAAVPRPPPERRGNPSSRALALVVLCLLLAGSVGVALMMRAGPMAEPGARTTTMRDQAFSQQVARAAAQMPSPTDGSSTSPTQPLDVATSATPAPRDTASPAETTIPPMAADVRLTNPPQPSAETSMFATPHDGVTEAIERNVTIIPKSEPEATPLPPIRPRRLALARTTSVRAASTIGNVTPAPSKEAVTTVAKQSDASAIGAAASSFSIQLASSLLESEALATLSRLKKQFPDALRGGSVRRAQGTGNAVFYRVQAGPLSRDAAENACSRLRAGGENCIVARS